MKGVALCLCLLFAFSASANSIEEALCRTISEPVARMAHEEKLCRSFSRALAALPAAVTDDAKALLTPENLTLMGTMTAAWLGSQGVPIVGQVVDGALLVLGVALLASQAADLTHYLWIYVNRARAARSTAELDEAATYLARALSLVGINVVAFILTKKVMAEIPRGPPSPLRELALPEGGHVPAAAMERAPSSVKAPAVFMAGSSGSGRMPPTHEGRPPKKPDSAAFEKWSRQAERRPAVEDPEGASDFQKKHAGMEEILVEGGGKEIWADGVRASDAHLLEAKYIEKPATSPFIEGSACDGGIRQIIRTKMVKEFGRYAAVILDPATPAVGLEVIVNDARALPYFQSLLSELGIPGRVVVKQ